MSFPLFQEGDLMDYAIKIRDFKESFFWGNVGKVVYTDETDRGLFLIGTTNQKDYKMFWAVNDLDDLEVGIKKARQTIPSFRFMYSGDLNTILEKKKKMNAWEVQHVYTHVAYRTNLKSCKRSSHPSVFLLNNGDKGELIKQESKLFTDMNLTKRDIRDWLTDHNHFALGIQKHDKLIGLILTKVNEMDGRTGFIKSIGVHPEFQHKGYGKTLIQAALDLLEKRGVQSLMCWLDINNLKARKFYEVVGFKIDETEAEIMVFFR